MRPVPTYTAWRIICESPDEAASLRQWISGRIDLARVLTDAVRIAPDGVEQVQHVPHRLGDYFAGIRILSDAPSNPAAFRLVFQRRPDAGRFWKDLMVNILEEIESMPQKTAVELASKGEMEPIAADSNDQS